MKESAVYQEILQEGMAKGEQLGLKKGEQLELTPFPLKKYTFRLKQKCVLKF